MKIKPFIKIEIVLLFAVAFLTIFMVRDVAYADEIIEFNISTTDGSNWILSKNGSTILEETGDWAKNEEVDEIFSSRIDTECSGKDYILTFDLPNDLICSFTDSTGVNPSSITTNPYTENADSQIFVTAQYENYIGGITYTYFYYKKETDLEYRYSVSQSAKTARFGMNVDVGTYDIIATVYEEFKYKDRDYRIERTSSNSLSCTINTSSDTPIEELTNEKLKIVYGKTLSEIATAISSNKGTYSLVDSSKNSYVPVVTGEKQKYTFNYYPTNTNYENKENIDVEITIIPKEIEVLIGDAQTKSGEDTIDLTTYPLYCYVKTPLVNGDTESNLNISFYFTDSLGNKVETIDKNSYGMYLIKAQFANANYKAVSINSTRNVYQGGRYYIFPVGIEYDTNEFSVSVDRLEGFENVIPKVIPISQAPAGVKELLEFRYKSLEKHIASAYVLYFEEQDNYSAERFTEEFFVTITPKDGVKYMLYNYNADFVEVDASTPFTIDFVPGSTDTYIYLVVLEDTIYYESGYMWYHTLLIVLSSLLLVTLVTIIIINKKKVWYFV